ncbi:hypothetical protein EAI_09097 [Harpegnathos saltator]|uniref:Uncharacterized protein n=1 Tax=Harpegnathos saltator TaxID=610380 RepID=E2B7K8_HARSA|nr:hypothetical protein EAI_09097 [Harpegnathos saltator]
MDRQTGEYEKAIQLSRMFARLMLTRSTVPEHRRVVDRLIRIVNRRNAPLSDCYHRMLIVYVDHVNLYQRICPEFLDFLLDANVMSGIPNRHRHVSRMSFVLLHLINATPSV